MLNEIMIAGVCVKKMSMKFTFLQSRDYQISSPFVVVQPMD